MWPNPQVPADLVKFTEETLNGKLHLTKQIDQRLTVLRKIPLVGWFSWNPCLVAEIEENKKK